MGLVEEKKKKRKATILHHLQEHRVQDQPTALLQLLARQPEGQQPARGDGQQPARGYEDCLDGDGAGGDAERRENTSRRSIPGSKLDTKQLFQPSLIQR